MDKHSGQAIREKRISAGVTQADIGNAIGMSQNWVSAVESGRSGIRITTELVDQMLAAIPRIVRTKKAIREAVRSAAVKHGFQFIPSNRKLRSK